MPRYVIAHEPARDPWIQTREFADDAAAIRAADGLALSLVRDHRATSKGERVTVKDESGRLVHEAYLTTAMMKP